MSYFDPKIYNKQNLKKEDLNELEYWHEVFTNVIDNTVSNDSLIATGSDTMDRIRHEIVEVFSENLKVALGYEMQDNCVSRIDNYDEDVDELKEYDTFLYDDKDDD